MHKYWGIKWLFTVIPAVLIACLVFLSLCMVSGEVVPNVTVKTTTNIPEANITESPTIMVSTTVPTTISTTTPVTTTIPTTTTVPTTTTIPVLPNTTRSLPATTKPAAVPILTLYQPEVNNLFVVVNGSATPGTDTNNEKISYISWEWGDGSKEVHLFPNSHTYSTLGKYEIRVTVHQSDGQSSSKNVSVIVNESFPTFLPTTATPTFPVTLPPILPPTLQPSPYLSLFVTSVNQSRVTIDGETAPGAVNSSITRCTGTGVTGTRWITLVFRPLMIMHYPAHTRSV